MSELPEDRRLAELLGAVRQLTETNQRIAASLAGMEAMYAAEQEARRTAARDGARASRVQGTHEAVGPGLGDAAEELFLRRDRNRLAHARDPVPSRRRA